MSATNEVMTRSRAKKVTNVNQVTEKDSFVNYCKTIDNLKKKILQQELLNKTLLDEQDTNAKEFEDLCKQTQQLKLKACKEEEKNIELHNLYQCLLNENKTLKNELEQWENQPACSRVFELESKLDLIIQENVELQNRYSTLLLHCNSSTKNGYKCLKRRYKNARNLKKKYKKINIKIEQLTSVNSVIEKELLHREYIIKALQEEGDKLLEIIQQNEKTLKEREVTYDKVLFLEEQLIKLKNLIQIKEKSNRPDFSEKSDIQNMDNDINVNMDNCNNMEAELNIMTKKDRIKVKAIKRSIVMLSDIYGKSVSAAMNYKLSDDYIIENVCKPHDTYNNIINYNADQKSKMEALIIVIGDYRTVKHDIHGYFQKIDDAAKDIYESKKRLIITTIAYTAHKEVNNKISYVNSKLFNIASLNDNITIVEINAHGTKPRIGVQNTLASNIITNLLNVGSSKNLTLIFTGDVILPPTKGNFPQATQIEVVK